MRTHEKPKRPRATWIAAGLIGAGAVVGVVALTLAITAPRGVSGGADMPWPRTGSAVVAVGDEVAASETGDDVRPIASIAKLVTALTVLDSFAPANDPAAYVDQTAFVMDPLDETIAAQERQSGGTVIDAAAGTVLSVREMLEATLVASSNNHARSLARHVAGDESLFLAEANAWLDERGLDSIELADVAGMSSDTKGSARDVAALARLAVANPLISEIVALPGITIRTGPTAPPQPFASTNDLLGTFGIDGIKTGATAAAGHSIVVGAPLSEDSSERIVVVVLGAPSAADRDTTVARLLAHVRASAD